MFSCEIAVIGGGLAGCSAALSLARSGADVALFEAGDPARHRVCGEFLSPESRATLGRLGLRDAVSRAGARAVSAARFRCGTQSAAFALEGRSGLALSRAVLDPLLWSAAQNAGARAYSHAKARQLRPDGEGFAFQIGAQSWRARRVILAAGRAAAPKPAAQQALFCGLKAHFAGGDLETGCVEMHLFRGGYCGLVRVEGGATNACLLADYPTLGRRAPDEFWQALLRENAGLRARLGGATRLTPWATTAAVCFERFRPSGEGDWPRGVLCAGDAAGYIHPFVGDGMAMALRAGELSAAVARQLHLTGDEAARLYRAAWQREFAPRLKLAARLHPLALRPQWAEPILPWLRALPPLSRALVRGTRGTAR